jgi:fibronectin-binding autotransporter adhesin
MGKQVMLKMNRTRRMNRALALGAVTSMMALASTANAATITFGAATTIAGDTDVLNGGLLHTAFNGSNTTQTVNGVQFPGSNNTTGWGSSLSWNMGAGGANSTSAFDDGAGAPFSGLSAAYRTILTGGNYNSGAVATGTVNNLTVGRVYAIQFWVNDTRSGSATRTETVANIGGGGAVTLDYNSTNANGGVGQYTIGTFTADAATQGFEFDGNSSSQVNAIQVRDITELKGIWTGLDGTAWNNTNAQAFSTNNFGSALTTNNFVNAKVATGGFVTFADNYYNGTTAVAATNTSVVVDAAGVSATNVYFDNVTLNYTFTNASGTVGITGATTLNKRGAGTVTLASANSHTGGNVVSGGILQVNSDAALGGLNNNTTISTGGTLRLGATITLANGHTLTANGGTINGNGFNINVNNANFLTGSGALTIQGNSSTNSTLAIGANQNISGPITIASGRIVVGAGLTNPLGTSNITIGTGTASLYVQGAGSTIGNNITFSTAGGESRGAIRSAGGATYTGTLTSTATTGHGGVFGSDVAVTNTINGELITAANAIMSFGNTANASATAVYDINSTNNANFKGVFSVGIGITDVASVSNYGVTSTIGNRDEVADVLNGAIGLRLAGGTLRYSGATNQSTDREIRLLNSTTNAIESSGTGTLSFTHTGANKNLFDTAGTRTLTLKGSNTGNNVFAIKLEDQSTNKTSLTKDGAGKWILSATDSTFTGNVTITNGNLWITHSNSLGAGTKSVFITNNVSGAAPRLRLDGSGGNITLASGINFLTSSNDGAIINESGNNVINGNFQLTSGDGSTAIVSNGGSLTLNGTMTFIADNRDLILGGTAGGTVNGNILKNAQPNVDLTKDGTGTWTLASTGNTYDETKVLNGILNVTGSLSSNLASRVFITKDANDNFNSGAAPELQRAVAGLTDLTGFGATEVGGLNTIASILAGSTNSATVIDMAFRGRNNAIVAGETSLLSSDILRLEGLDGVVFVLQMSYSEAAALANGQAETTLRLGYLNTALNRWEDAVLGNHGTNTGSFFLSSYTDAGSPLDLGSFGVDVVNNVVWAVLDHNSFFAVIPTPGALPAGMLLMGLVIAAKRRRHA